MSGKRRTGTKKNPESATSLAEVSSWEQHCRTERAESRAQHSKVHSLPEARSYPLQPPETIQTAAGSGSEQRSVREAEEMKITELFGGCLRREEKAVLD